MDAVCKVEALSFSPRATRPGFLVSLVPAAIDVSCMSNSSDSAAGFSSASGNPGNVDSSKAVNSSVAPDAESEISLGGCFSLLGSGDSTVSFNDFWSANDGEAAGLGGGGGLGVDALWVGNAVDADDADAGVGAVALPGADDSVPVAAGFAGADDPVPVAAGFGGAGADDVEAAAAVFCASEGFVPGELVGFETEFEGLTDDAGIAILSTRFSGDT